MDDGGPESEVESGSSSDDICKSGGSDISDERERKAADKNSESGVETQNHSDF